MTTEEAIRHLREDPARRDLVRSSYLDDDPAEAAARFAASGEFAETLALVRRLGTMGQVLDLGAGTGIASAAFAEAGARRVVALEPDESDVVGLGCLRTLVGRRPISPVCSYGDTIPLVSASIDVVYCRQVLHHIEDLPRTIAECARVLRPGGLFLAVREHVVDDELQLEQFRAEHPVHQLAGGEGAHSLETYRGAIAGAGLDLVEELATWDSIVNAFPDVANREELSKAPAVLLGRRYGAPGRVLGSIPGVRGVVWRRLRRDRPGRLYSFVARKPAPGGTRPVDTSVGR